MTCEQLQQLLGAGSLIKACGSPRHGSDTLRIQTQFRYHGGEYVDIFWKSDEGVGEFTDLGQTIGQLLSMNVDPDSTVTRRHFVEDVCQDLGVRRDGGKFVCSLGEGSPQSVLSAFMRLGQACVRIADLFVTHRPRLSSAFGDDLDEGLQSLDRPLERDVVFPGRGGRQVVVDYVLTGPTRQSAILAMTATNQTRAHDVANDTFTKWFDLQGYQDNRQFVTVMNSEKGPLFRDTDITRIELYSSIVTYPEEGDRLRDLLLV